MLVTGAYAQIEKSIDLGWLNAGEWTLEDVNCSIFQKSVP